MYVCVCGSLKRGPLIGEPLIPLTPHKTQGPCFRTLCVSLCFVRFRVSAYEVSASEACGGSFYRGLGFKVQGLGFRV